MSKSKTETHEIDATPLTHQRGRVVQEFGTVVNIPVGLDEKVRLDSTRNLNQVLADTLMIRDLYKKHHWQLSAPLTRRAAIHRIRNFRAGKQGNLD
jgi:starvation-inducible DNA-binding protein